MKISLLKKVLKLPAIFFVLIVSAKVGISQINHQINADSVVITNNSAGAELNLENSSRNIKGFLYNTGNGRTQFRRALIRDVIDSNRYFIGADTLKIPTSAGTPGGADTYVQYKLNNALAADSGLRWKSTGQLAYTKKYHALRLAPTLTTVAANDTLIALTIQPRSNLIHSGAKVYDVMINSGYVRFDSLYNFSVGNGTAGAPPVGYSNFLGVDAGKNDSGAYKSNFIGYKAGEGAINARLSNFFGEKAGSAASEANGSNFFGQYAGQSATNASNSNFLGYGSGQYATGASNSNFLGYWAGYGATSSSNSNFLGANAGRNATGAIYSNFIGESAGLYVTSGGSNFIGTSAGAHATGSSNANYIGQQAGIWAAAAHNSNFIGYHSGDSAVNANFSNFFGRLSGYKAINASSSNFMGNSAGSNAANANSSNFFGSGAGTDATAASQSNFFGSGAGRGAKTASYSTFIGYHVGDSVNSFAITGSNNILIGNNITTPTATTANTFNLGNVLYGTNTYSTLSSAPSSVAQTNGQVGINVATPNASSVLDITSTSKGLLPPRLTLAQRNAVVSPAAGLIVYCTDCTATDGSTGVMQTYNGSNWKNYW